MSYYWESYRKTYCDARLLWYGDNSNENFWTNYWREKLTIKHYEKLAQTDLNNSAIGKILLRELCQDDKILEAGCGSGDWVAILLAHGYSNIIGIDYSKELVQLVNNLVPGLNIQWGDALKTQFNANTFDAYLSFGVIEHRMDGPDPFLAEAYRILRPDGKLFLSVPCVGPLRLIKSTLGMYQGKTDDLSFFQYGFGKQELTQILNQNGFSIKASQFIGIDRLWLEEIEIYRKLSRFNIVRKIQRMLASLFENIDGHMILISAVKTY